MYYSTKVLHLRTQVTLAGFCYLVFLLPKLLTYLASNHLTLSISDEGYSRNASCVLNYKSTFNINKLVPIIEIRGL